MTTTTGQRSHNPAATLIQLRALHTWIGMLIAPTVLFMAVTGIVQIYNLHEEHPGYTPPALIEKLSALHKDQVFQVHHHHPPPELHAPQAMGPTPSAHFRKGAPPGEGGHAQPVVTLLKAFLTVVAAGLIVSILIGLWMGLRKGQPRLLNAILILIGIAAPLGLIALGG